MQLLQKYQIIIGGGRFTEDGVPILRTEEVSCGAFQKDNLYGRISRAYHDIDDYGAWCGSDFDIYIEEAHSLLGGECQSVFKG
jgi:hypothetical protein